MDWTAGCIAVTDAEVELKFGNSLRNSMVFDYSSAFADITKGADGTCAPAVPSQVMMIPPD